MRHKYQTEAIVLARYPVAEGSAHCVLLTPELGLIRVRAQGVRKSGAKLAAALATFAECDAIVLRGREGWRLSGAVLKENWFSRMNPSGRARAGRIAGLLLRLVQGESADPALYRTLADFFEALGRLPEEEHDAAETLAALRLVAALGLDAGALPAEGAYDSSALRALGERGNVIARVNRGIAASGL
ncbi:MAG: recombination protein O N-terminal domain-containing protein [Patescibacteria group bacterium]|nr:recombination protein O N-terminal domain-containing protein [Patescibacteria group bacterium]